MENKKESPALYRWSPSRPRWSDRADFNRYSDDEDNIANAKEGYEWEDDWEDGWEAANRATWEGEEIDLDYDGNPRQIPYFTSESESSESESDSHIKEPSSRDSHKCASVEEEEAFRKAKKDPSPPDSHEYASTEEEAFREAKKDPSPTDSHESASTEEEKAFREAKEAPKSVAKIVVLRLP